MHAPPPPEDELRFNEQRLRTLALSTSVVLWQTAQDGSVARANPSWEIFTGQAYEAYVGWGWLDAVHPDDRAAAGAGWQQAMATLQPMQLRYRLRRHDGEYRDVDAQGAPVMDQGVVREWVGLCVDVTDTRRAEAALKASEERLRFLDRIGQATRALTDANAVMAVTARLLGEHLGTMRCAYADVDADSDRFTIRADWSRPGAASSVGVYSLTMFGPQATGNLRQGRSLVVNDVDRELGDDGGGRMFNAIGIKAVVCAGLVKEGRLVALMAVHQSAPHQWTAQELAIIEEVVDRCWAHIERVRDNAMLREQDRHKDEFLATLAHELRNPLAPVKYAVAMLRRAPDFARQTQAQDIIDRQATHMARLIDDLLDVSRINRGLITLQRSVVPLRPLMLQAVETARPAIEAARHRLTLALPDDGLRVDVDQVRIVQVIGNLLTNAAKYTPDGGDIRLAAWVQGHRVVVEVVDNGVGVPPDQQGRLFQLFTQLHHVAGRTQGGLGIGLSLVKRLVEMHGGAVRMRSAGLDEGSAFTIELPLALPLPPGLQGDTGPAGDGQPAGAPAAPAKRVLVVEDNADGRESLVALLSATGYDVKGVSDGHQAVALVRSFRPHVVLLDLGLPGMDGYQVARALRAEPPVGDAPAAMLVALTGWGAASDKARTAEAGFDGHLTKPVEPDALLSYLDEITAAAAG